MEKIGKEVKVKEVVYLDNLGDMKEVVRTSTEAYEVRTRHGR